MASRKQYNAEGNGDDNYVDPAEYGGNDENAPLTGPVQYGYATDNGLIIGEPHEPNPGRAATNANGEPLVGELGNTERPREYMLNDLPQRGEPTPQRPREPIPVSTQSPRTFEPMQATIEPDVVRRITTQAPGVRASVFNQPRSRRLLGKFGGLQGGGLHVPGVLGSQGILSALYKLLMGQED